MFLNESLPQAQQASGGVVFLKGRLPQAQQASGGVVFLKGRLPQAQQASGAVVFLNGSLPQAQQASSAVAFLKGRLPQAQHGLGSVVSSNRREGEANNGLLLTEARPVCWRLTAFFGGLQPQKPGVSRKRFCIKARQGNQTRRRSGGVLEGPSAAGAIRFQVRWCF